jgi:hypothetical protein
VHRSIIAAYPEADISSIVVWINMLETDNQAKALQAAAGFSPDPRVRYFHGPDV